jgi:prepilin-type N-terminal cleavage/methylation domain-containing protein
MTSIADNKLGFSLVELSMVLVILGLLTGGILAGKSLIRAAEVRAVSTEYKRFRTAIEAFRGKYFGLPGDLNNAVQFWGRADGGVDLTQNCAAPSTDVGTGTQTCNGNGDSGVMPSQLGGYEDFRAYQHLANAGLIEGSYTGIASTGAIIGTNTIQSKIANATWWYRYRSKVPLDLRNMLNYGTVVASSTKRTDGPALRPEEAWGIDSKMDDGLAASGWITTRTGTGYTGTSCVDGSSEYDLTNSEIACTVTFYIDR